MTTTTLLAAAPVVETVECRRGTVTLTTTATGWSIVGRSSTHPNRVYRVTIARCNCLGDDVPDELICPRETHGGGCNADGGRLLHCRPRNLGHGPHIRVLFEKVCRSYQTAVPTTAAQHRSILNRVSPDRRITLTAQEKTALANAIKSP